MNKILNVVNHEKTFSINVDLFFKLRYNGTANNE